MKLSDYVENGEYPVISITNIDKGFKLDELRKITREKFLELKRSAIIGGDILIAKIGSSYGKVGIYPDYMPTGIIPANLLKITSNHLVSKVYIIYFLNSPAFKLQLDKIVRFTAQPAFNMTAFKRLLFPLPPLNEQKRIVAKVETLMQICDRLEEQINQSEQTAERLMDAVVQGIAGR